jgi:hypothetical protein
MLQKIHGYITLSILTILLAATGIWYAAAPLVYNTVAVTEEILEAKEERPLYAGNHVVANLTTMKVELRNGTTTLETFDILSKGKPGSYYETIGGAYENDYKIKRHFSSFGSVYLPWSVHVYGNYFIHGVPYYPNGTEVSSTYSGGCIRLKNEDAEAVYEFVERGTPIIITQGTEEDFRPTATATPNIASMDMVRLMSAVVSLEVLAQDTVIRDIDGESTTRRELLPLLLTGDDSVSKTYAKAVGEEAFLNYMNEKAHSLGLSNTRFASLAEPVMTTGEDIARFNTYIENYKTYLLTLVRGQG